MVDRRRQRGPHPADPVLFAPERLPVLRTAVEELSWLLTRGYPATAALKLVGDRHRLTARQRLAAGRCACGDADREARRARCVPPCGWRGRTIGIDGFNVLTTVETAWSGGLVLGARDGCFRDLAGMHGSYRLLAVTAPAVRAVLEVLRENGADSAVWFLERPVSNSGRLAAVIREWAEETGVRSEVRLVPDADPLLREEPGLVATADSGILDRGVRWVNLARETVQRKVPGAWIVGCQSAEEGWIP